MSLPEDMLKPVATDPDNSSNSLFMGDTGELPLETRRTLMQLLAGPYLDARRHAKLWQVLRRDESIIRNRLADLFLTLVFDPHTEVAFIRQADTGELEVPSLLRRAQLTFIDSVLLLFLRQQLIQADSHGERAVISIEEIEEHLRIYARVQSTDQAGFAKRVQTSVEKIKKYNILQRLRASEGRFEISPTLKLLFSAEEIQVLITLYQRMAAEKTKVEEGL